MGSATAKEHERVQDVFEKDGSVDLSLDPRWQLVERIAQSEPFQKSTRLPKLLFYLARHTIEGGRRKLTEQAIGQAVFGKGQHYDPAEDSSVRVYARQLRLRLHEYYHSLGQQEELIVSIPRGGYMLDFSPAASQNVLPGSTSASLPQNNHHRFESRTTILSAWSSAILLALTLLFGFGWYRATAIRPPVAPWPLSNVFHKGMTTTLVTADAGYALRNLGDKEIPLDQYIDHSYLQPILPKHMSENESAVLHYFDSTRITSEADAEGAGVISSLAGPYSENLTIRSARDVNANDLSQGNFIFIGSKTSNPWVELLDSRMNFQIVENGPHGSRYLLNSNPHPGEKNIYESESMGTLESGDDYAVIALLPTKGGGGSSLLLEGVRMEGTEAAIALLRSPLGREKLQNKLASINNGRPPEFFEALLRAQSVAGANISEDVIAARVLQQD
jgi:hypothetical protein